MDFVGKLQIALKDVQRVSSVKRHVHCDRHHSAFLRQPITTDCTSKKVDKKQVIKSMFIRNCLPGVKKDRTGLIQ